ncbi:YybH family protein [Burkholderiaceae bacterium UC74_6]
MWETVLSLMTDDVVFLVTGRPLLRTAAFEAMARRPPGGPRPKFEGQATVQEVQASGDMAYAWTQLSVKVTSPGDEVPTERAGPVLSVLRRVDGRWLLARDASLLSPVTP